MFDYSNMSIVIIVKLNGHNESWQHSENQHSAKNVLA